MREFQPDIPEVLEPESESEEPSEPPSPPLLRKVVVLGDTRAPDAMIPLITSTPGQVSLLIHEATDCCIPHTIDPESITGRNRTVVSVHRTSMERGHSTPDMAGRFAKAIEADRLVLNHIGGRSVFLLPAVHRIFTIDRLPSSGSQHHQTRHRVHMTDSDTPLSKKSKHKRQSLGVTRGEHELLLRPIIQGW